MASPQLENGYTRIANELLEALCRLKISGNEMRILLFIIRKTYGYSRKSAQISLSEIAKATGIKSNHVSEILRGLVEKRVIEIERSASQGVVPQTISVVKDYQIWEQFPKIGTVPKNRNSTIPENGNSSVPEFGNSSVPENGNPYLYKRKYKENIKERGKESAPARKNYGFFGEISLTDEEYSGLVEEFGEKNVLEYIRRIDRFSHNHEKKYDDCYDIIRRWLFRDGVSKPRDSDDDIEKYKIFINNI